VDIPSDAQVQQWYQQHYNAGFYGLLSFMGLDSAEVFAEGCMVRAADGREFIDCVGGYGSYNFGHRHPKIVAAVKAQLDAIPMSSKLLLNGQLAALAHELAEIAPGELTYTFCSNSGTEAVEAALKLARLASGKPGIITANNAFHGKTLGSLSGTNKESFQQPFLPLLQHFTTVPFGDLDALEAAIGDDTAAVMLEPVQGEGGIIVPPEGYLRGAREITRRRGVLLIMDEVQTGLGRTGLNFASELELVDPDILVLAKSLGGGVMPIGATMGTQQVWEHFQENPLVHTSTFGGNELACAAARAALQELLPVRPARAGRRVHRPDPRGTRHRPDDRHGYGQRRRQPALHRLCAGAARAGRVRAEQARRDPHRAATRYGHGDSGRGAEAPAPGVGGYSQRGSAVWDGGSESQYIKPNCGGGCQPPSASYCQNPLHQRLTPLAEAV